MIGNRLDDGVGYTQRCVIFWLKRWFGISDELEGEISVFEDPTHGEFACKRCLIELRKTPNRSSVWRLSQCVKACFVLRKGIFRKV